MENQKEDKDWINEYQTLKQVNPTNPFAVPSAYFNEMGEQLTAHLNLDRFGINEASDGFVVPHDYFTQLEQNIKSRVVVESLVKQAEGFTVPSDYFDGLVENIETRVAIDELVGDESFTIPNGYFDELEHNIKSRIVIEELVNKENFTIPTGYFEELQENVQSRIEIEELISRDTFTIPAGYFDELGRNIQSRIAIEKLISSDTFTVPEGYFDEVASNIEARIAVGELVVESKESFRVPTGYFNDLENRILQQTTLLIEDRQPGTKLENKERRGVVVKLWAKHAVKYATAACFALVVGTGIMVSEFNTTGAAYNRKFLHKQLSKISQDDIQSYLELNSDITSIADNAGMSDLDALPVSTTSK